MRKLLFIFALITIGLIISSCSNSQKKEWTVLIYMNGDNSLSDSINPDINQMEASQFDEEKMNIVVQADYNIYAPDPRPCIYDVKNDDDKDKISPLTQTDKMTLVGWFKSHRSDLNQTIISKLNEYRVYIDGSDLKFMIWNKNKHSYTSTTSTIKSNVTDGKWHFFAVTASYSSIWKDIYIDFYYGDGVSNQTEHTKEIYIEKFKPKNTNNDLFIGATQWNKNNNPTNYFDGFIDELAMLNVAASKNDIDTYYKNQKNHEDTDSNGNAVERNCECDCQNQQPKTNGTFNAVDYVSGQCNAVNDWDNNITTKIVNNDFNLTILAKNKNTNIPFEANITKVDFYEYNTNDCSGNYNIENICNNCGKTSVNGCLAVKNIKINKAVKCIKVHIEGNVTNPVNPLQESNSTDDFAIRPNKFEITNIPSKIKAGEEFNITLKALDSEGNPAKDYNESVYIDGNSADLEYNISKKGCDNGILSIISGNKFNNGEANVTLKYNEVGDVNLNLKEVNTSEFAKVDEDDTNESMRFIQAANAIATFIPHHFKANTVINNYDTDFTYLDNNLSIYSLIDLNITAENEENKTVKNYNKECYAKNTDVNLTPNLLRHNNSVQKEAVYKIGYFDHNSSVYHNNDINFSVGKGNFTTDNNGSAIIKVYTNFERNSSNPVNPFEFNISNAEVNDSDTNLTYLNVDGSALFYYGFINMNDIITSKNDFNISHEILVYDNNASDNYKPDSEEILFNWYLNTYNHKKDSNIFKFQVTKGYIYKKSDILNGVSIKVVDINDSLHLEVKRADTNINFAVVHIIDGNASHLWYSKYKNEYNISEGSSCVNHFCFTVTWPEKNNIYGVKSGDLNGTKAKTTESNSTKRGVKIFR